MATISAVVRPVSGTATAVGSSGGMGLGFNGGQLLALAIAGCLANDLRYAAADPEDPHLDTVRVVADVDVVDGRVADSTVLAAVRSGFAVEVLDA